jgi:malonyl-CoA/methylmalonyl-CoA synthetase
MAEVDLLSEGTLPAAWSRQFTADPSHPTLLFPGTGSATDTGGDLPGRPEASRAWVTAGDLDADTRRVAARYRHAGLRPGDRVLISAASSYGLVVAHVAALRSGLVVVPANTAYREREIAHLVGDAEPAGAVVDDRDRAGWIAKASGGRTLVVGPEVDLPDGADVEVDRAAPGDPAIVAYTSGTTGAPKGAVLSHANLLASAAAVALAWRWTKTDRLVLALPLFHIHGLGVGLQGTLLAGASAVVMPSFDPDGILDAAARHDATLFFGVPTMYARLAASPRLAELARFRLCVSGSAPLPPAVFGRIEDGSGHRPLERYGMTETGMNISNPYDGERRPGTVGRPLPGVGVRLSDTGEILLRGPNVFGGYWRNPAATEAAFEDGWFHSGDMAEYDDAGYVRIVGRARELIITGGLNVYPREVEDVLLTHPAVGEVAVVGRPDEEWSEVVTAYVVPAGPAGAGLSGAGPDALLDLDGAAPAILAHAADQLAAFKRPRAVHFVESLPRNALGKVLRQNLPR